MNRRSFLKFAAVLAAVPIQVLAWTKARYWYPRDGRELHEILNDRAKDGDFIVLLPGKTYRRSGP